MIRVFLDLTSAGERVRIARLLAAEQDLQIIDDAESAHVVIASNAAEHPDDVPVLVLLEQADHSHVTQALRAGIRGAIPANVTGSELAAAVRAVYHGWVVRPPEPLAAAAPVEALTARELEVFRMLADGLSNKEIAQRLGISEHTVKFHVNSIMGKLGAGSRTEAVTAGLRSGLILL